MIIDIKSYPLCDWACGFHAEVFHPFIESGVMGSHID